MMSAPLLMGIARQQWRARIETLKASKRESTNMASPASNGGRGLKPSADVAAEWLLKHRPPAMAGAD